MSYEEPIRTSHFWNGIDFSGGDATRQIRGPKGKKGKVVLVTANPTTSFVGTTSPGKVQVGDGTTANKYADLFLGAAGAGTAAGSVAVANDYASGLTGLVAGAFLTRAADSNIVVTFKSPVDGGVAGVADVLVEVEWF
jgi:hypothetical protein